ncbi:atypical chemokine receptor 2-like [Melanotaenia boesemani]|uniref:atypical chemokine receptor 2-like n=1 Tax=Melanotaenia boesemani TaxID=1250792 RepID=UPI001C03CD0A|nr:atypical chemokine receptor 2-like [Melanotaenia boesemani]
MSISSDDYDYNFFHNDTETLDTYNEPSAFQLYAVVYLTLIFCISMPGNSFMLWVLLRERAWRITSDVLLLQFTVSNLCFTATLPFFACNVLHGWIFGEWACGIKRGLALLGLNSHVVIITAMTLHCYVTVVQPSCLPAQTPSKFRVLVASIAIWLISAAPSIKLAVNSRVIDFGDVEFCTFGMESLTMMFIDLNVELWLFFVIPLIIVTFCYIHMWITIKQCREKSYLQPSKSISRATAGFFLCLAPHNIHVFVESLMVVRAVEYRVEWTHVIRYIVYVTFALTHLYPCLSPMFHMFGAQRFRRHLPMPCIASTQNRDGVRSDTSVQFMSLSNE